jgi:hypothetical protein
MEQVRHSMAYILLQGELSAVAAREKQMGPVEHILSRLVCTGGGLITATKLRGEALEEYLIQNADFLPDWPMLRPRGHMYMSCKPRRLRDPS